MQWLVAASRNRSFRLLAIFNGCCGLRPRRGCREELSPNQALVLSWEAEGKARGIDEPKPICSQGDLAL
jgi:hypothetical protein